MTKSETEPAPRNWSQIVIVTVNGLLVLLLTLAGLYFGATVTPMQNDIGEIKSELKALRKVLVIEWRVTRLEERLRDLLARRSSPAPRQP